MSAATLKAKPEPTYHPLCFHCGSEKELRPYQSWLWGKWHICRNCESEGATIRAARLAQKAKRSK